MEQFEQLLTCAICLDRYKNPKLLPCQHSFCMEPCMDGLVDYVRRQVKCPECRAEHRIPYQGVQGFPTNVTLQRFLELHIEITGELPDPTSGQIMERCNVCSEKSYCGPCVHCDKKICADCKGAHMDILRREIARINNQVRRALHRLQDALALVEKNTVSLQLNCTSVAEEVDEIYRRLAKALKDRTEFLRNEVDRYMCTEQRNLLTLKDNLEVEISNIQSNCDLADKHMTDTVEWDDCELMDAKEIFLKTVEFIRNFEYENVDYNRRVRFAMAHDPNQLVLHVAGYGELNINMPHAAIMPSPSSSGMLQPPGGPGLMRSKSDHRLATQFRQQEERAAYGDRGNYGEDTGEPLGGRKFGERYGNRSSSQVSQYEAPTSRYGRNSDYGSEFESPYDNEKPRRYRSRFTRHLGEDDAGESEQGGGRSVRFQGSEKEPMKERERVLDTEDVAKGPLSGIFRLLDSPRVMKRLQESEMGKKEKKEVPLPVVKPLPQVKAAAVVPKKVSTTRQVSEEDEIAKIKKQNKSGASTAAAKEKETPTSPTVTTPPVEPARPPPVPEAEAVSSEEESDDEDETESVSALAAARKAATAATTAGSTAASRRSSASSDVVPTPHKKAVRSASTDSSSSSESSTASSKVAHTGAAYTTEEVKQKILSRGSIDKGTTSPADSTAGSGASTPTRTRVGSTASETTTKPAFQSRFLGAGRPTPPAATVDKKEETESSSEEETSSEEESEPEPPKKTTAQEKMEKTDIGPLLARSAQARESSDSRKNSRDDTGYKSRYSTDDTSSPTRYGSKPEEPASSTRTRYGESRYAKEEPVKEPPKYGRSRVTEPEPEKDTSRFGTSGYTSRFLNKSKSTAALSPEEEAEAKKLEDTRYPSGRTRYAALKDRRSRLSRSRSSHNFGGEDGEEEEAEPKMPASYLASRYGPGASTTSGTDLARSRSTHALKAGDSPERASTTTASGEKDGAALSSWARYLKNKYGNRATGKDGTTAAPASSAASSAASRRLSLGLPLRNSLDSSDDDQKNMSGSPTSPTAAQAGFAVAGTNSPRSQYMQKRRQQFKIGERGSEAGCFTWPRGIAVGPDNTIVVADSSNHRVQVFDSQGIFVKEFGSYGNGEGEFDCLAGVAVNRIGQFIIADRYNHRIQVLDPSGRFLRAFGSQGTADGRFNYPWGITTDALGFIYVCDKENHRVQVFQSDGMFVGKFGSSGSKPGQLEHPHYIAVSNTNRVIVSDSNNHRIQIFDVNGRVLTTFGSEGSEEGQFKFPRGVAVDDQGYICVADSGNNRIQIFHPDGTFLRAFGNWGSGDGEFKGLEGVAVMSNGNILVCDRENHRVQVF